MYFEINYPESSRRRKYIEIRKKETKRGRKKEETRASLFLCSAYSSFDPQNPFDLYLKKPR